MRDDKTASITGANGSGENFAPTPLDRASSQSTPGL